MSPERICSAVVYIAEAITAGLYFKVLFAPKKTAKVRVMLLTIVYFLLWLSFQLGNFFVNALLFFAYKIYGTAFIANEMGYACALAWFLFLIIGGLTLLAFKTNKWVYYGDGGDA